MRFLLWSWDEHDLVDLVHLDELHLHALAACGGQVLADVVGADGQLAVAAVAEDGEPDGAGPAVVEQRLDRRADRAAGVEDVVDEDAVFPSSGKSSRVARTTGCGWSGASRPRTWTSSR